LANVPLHKNNHKTKIHKVAVPESEILHCKRKITVWMQKCTKINKSQPISIFIYKC